MFAEKGSYRLCISIFGLVLCTSLKIEQEAVDSGALQVNIETSKELGKAKVTLIRETTTLGLALYMMRTVHRLYEESEHAKFFKEFHEETWTRVRQLFKEFDEE
jgi:hypothetical protein